MWLGRSVSYMYENQLVQGISLFLGLVQKTQYMTFPFMNNSLGETLSHNLFYHIYSVADGISEVPIFDLHIYFFSWLLYDAYR